MKGIVFDKDGTLFDFNATWGAWSLKMLESEAGGDPRLLETLADVLGYDVKRRVFRPGSIVIAETTGFVAEAMLPYLPGTSADELMVRMKTAAGSVPQIEAAPLKTLLPSLRARGLRLGVVTNDNEGPARIHLAKAEVTDQFAFIAGYDSGHGQKPAPGPLLAFCAATGIAPQDCAMVGDSLHDLHAGRAAGMVTVGVLTGPARREELAPFADVILPSVADLPAWLDQA